MTGQAPTASIIAVAEGNSAKAASGNVGAIFADVQLHSGPAAVIFRCDRTTSGDVVVALQFLVPRQLNSGHFVVYLMNFLARPDQYPERSGVWTGIAETFRFLA